MVKIKSPVTGNLVWMPPGGGLEFGETLEECLQREFREETGLHIGMGDFVFLNELLEPPFHAIELFYKVHKKGGKLKKGTDPEHHFDEQLIKDLAWIPVSSLREIPVSPKKIISYFENTL